MESRIADRYLDRIGCSRPGRPTTDALRDLHQAHLLTVPFENLSIHLGEAIVLDEDLVLDKIIDRRRGGFCYELNGAFGLLLQALGYRVTFLAARVFDGERPGPPFDHLVLRVDTTEAWLVDVGFGEHSRYPLAFDEIAPQHDPSGAFQLEGTSDGDVDVRRDGVPQYRVEVRPRQWSDFVPMCWWHQSSPQSHFTQSIVCSMARPGGRVTMSDRRLIRTGPDGRTETTLLSEAEILAAYRDNFGISLASCPRRGDRVAVAEQPFGG